MVVVAAEDEASSDALNLSCGMMERSDSDKKKLLPVMDDFHVTRSALSRFAMRQQSPEISWYPKKT